MAENRKKPQKRGSGQPNFKKFKDWLSKASKEYQRIIWSVGAIILGLVAFWQGLGQWWFGFPLPTWIYFIMPASLLVIWVVAFCGYYAEAHPEQKQKIVCGYYKEAHPERKKEEEQKEKQKAREKVKLRSLSLNVIVMIAIPALFLSFLGVYIAMEWRRLTEKIVILVEPFEEIGGIQNDLASGNELEGIAKTIKRELDRAIQEQEKRLNVRVVLGKRHEQELSKEAQLEEYTLKYRADMVISGWYLDDPNKDFLVCPKFQVVRVPKSLPAVFRARANVYPENIVFNAKEIENINMNFTLGKRLTYEPILVLGAGAYASGDWKTAQQLFADALSIIEKPDSPEKESETKKNEVSSIEKENLKEDANTVPAANQPESSKKDPKAKKRGKFSDKNKYKEGDKTLLYLYIGHCLMHRSQHENAILQYDNAIEAGKKIPPSDMRYGEILASAYLARGVAYRQVNAFELARQDFETAGGHLPTSLGLRPLRAEEARFLGGDREKLINGAEKYYNRGEEYLIQRQYKHAQAYLEMSVEFYRRLMKGMPTPTQENYSLRLAQSLIRLGEIQNRQAKPELLHDEVTLQAIKYLDEGINLTRRFSKKEDPNMLKIRADGLRHQGEAYRAMDDIDQVPNAFNCHVEAKIIWKKMVEPNDPERIRGIANEWIRIGDVFRRLCDIDPTATNYNKRLKYAEDAYYRAALELEGIADVNDKKVNSYIKTLNSDSSKKIDGNSVLNKIVADITAHHMAYSLSNLAQIRLERYLRAQNKYKADPNKNPKPNEEDVIIAEKCLSFAVECYTRAVNKLEKGTDRDKWIDQINRIERNNSLRDDLSWCQTLHGYVLLKKTKMSTVSSPGKVDVNDIYKELTKAKEDYEKLGYADQGHVVLNLFALTASQVELDNKQQAKQTLLDACKLLRDLTREKKKVWYVDYVCDIMENLRRKDFQFETDDDVGNLEKIETWLTAGTVREGRRALDEIIKGIEKKVGKPSNLDAFLKDIEKKVDKSSDINR